VLLLAGYVVRDVLWLRIFCFAAGLFNVPFWLLQDSVAWEPFVWTIVFTSIHAFWAVRLIRERRPVKFSLEEQQVYEHSFPTLSPNEMKLVLGQGKWLQSGTGEYMQTSGEPVGGISVVISGVARVESLGGELVRRAESGEILGGVEFATGDPAPVSWIADKPTSHIFWRTGDISALFTKSKNIEVAFNALIAKGLSRHLIFITEKTH
jgi:hypothetical protein